MAAEITDILDGLSIDSSDPDHFTFKTTTSTSQAKGFRDLPTELRLKIFCHAIPQEIEVCMNADIDCLTGLVLDDPLENPALPMMLVCKDFFEEVSILPAPAIIIIGGSSNVRNWRAWDASSSIKKLATEFVMIDIHHWADHDRWEDAVVRRAYEGQVGKRMELAVTILRSRYHGVEEIEGLEFTWVPESKECRAKVSFKVEGYLPL